MKSTIFSALMLSALTLTACSDDDFAGDPIKDLSSSMEFLTPVEEAGSSTYYKPALGRVGDPMPFYDQKAGNFKIMYLQEYDNNIPGRYHPYWAVETKDGANYQSLGEWLPVGASTTSQDAILGTGCCYYNAAEDLYYIYYTGENETLPNRQVVMRATSKDLKTWTRDKLWALYGKDFGISTQDFRDPQIFEEGGKYHMVISTRPAPKDSHPFFAEFVSDNMKDWEFVGTFNMLWERMYECPDVFQMGKYWYIVYSDSNKENWGRSVKYMMADSWADLKAKFANDQTVDHEQKQLDSRCYYAGKTAFDGTDRYIWGWASHHAGSDYNEKNANVGGGSGKEPAWSGALVCHKLMQDDKGLLYTAKVPAIEAKYNKPLDVKVLKEGEDYTLYSRLGNHNHISFTLKAPNAEAQWGISFARGDVKRVIQEGDEKKTIIREVEKYYSLVMLNAGDNRVIRVDQLGDDGVGKLEGSEGIYFPRPADNVYNVDIYTDNSVLVMYIDGKYGCTQRIYGMQRNCWSIDSFGNDIEVSNLKVTQY